MSTVITTQLQTFYYSKEQGESQGNSIAETQEKSRHYSQRLNLLI